MSLTRLCVDVTDGMITLLQAEGKPSAPVVTGQAVKEAVHPGDPLELADEIMTLVQENDLASDSYLLTIDSRNTLLKTFYFPFTGRNKISMALDLELESVLPLPMDQLLTDWISGPREGKGSWVLATCARREFLETLIKALNASGIAPERVTLDVSSIMGNPAVRGDGSGSTVVVELGRTRTLLLYQEEGRLRHRDVLDRGVMDLVAELEQSGMTFDQAYRALFMSDFTLQASSSEKDEKQIQLPRDILEKYISDIGRAFTFALERVGGEWGKLVLCGEGLNIRGIKELIGNACDIPARLLIEEEGYAQVFTEPGDATAYARAYGTLCLTGKTPTFSFVAGTMGQGVNRTGWKANLPYYGAWGGALVASLLGLFVLGLYSSWSTVSVYDERIEKIFHEAVPTITGNFDRTQKLSILKGRINDLEQTLAKGKTTQRAALDSFREISEQVGADVPINLSDLTLNKQRVSLVGTAPNYKDVEELRQRLVSGGSFQSVSIKGASTEKSSKQIRFELELVRKRQG